MDRIDLLEAKIKQMIDLVQALRDENRSLRERLDSAEVRAREIGEERKVLDRERDAVRGRIEQLLGELADVEGAADQGAAPAAGEPAGRAAERPATDYADNPVLPGLT
jgi:FtsZ-binding cell division protein ZapB